MNDPICSDAAAAATPATFGCERVARILRAYARERYPRAGDPGDLVADAVGRAYRAASRRPALFEDLARPAAFVAYVKLCIRTAADPYLAHADRHVDIDPIRERAERTTSATRHALACPDVSALRDAVAAAPMSPDQREALRLRAAGYSYREIAAATGVPVGTVKTRIHHARKRLAPRLRAAGYQVAWGRRHVG